MDFASIKGIAIPQGSVKTLRINGALVWQAGAEDVDPVYTNLVPLSTDTDGSIYNGVGYRDNARLSSSGGVSGSAQNGSTTTGFIPWGGGTDILRLKGVDWVHVSGNHFYVNFYNASKGFLANMSAQVQGGGDYDHVLTVTRESGVTTFVWNTDYGTTNTLLQNVRKAKFIRITAKGKGADMIVTINEEIT